MRLTRPIIPTPAQRLGQPRPGLLGQILAEGVPDLFTLDDQMAALIAAAAKIPAPDAGADARAAVLTALDAGKVDSLDLVRIAAGDAEAIPRWERTRTVLDEVMSTLREQQDAALRRSAPTIMARLDATVKTAVDGLRAHPITVRRVRSAEAAIGADMADVWGEYTSLRARYHEAYAALGALSGLIDDVVLRSATGTDSILTRVAHPEQVWPQHLPWRKFGTGYRYSTTRTTIGRPPWPNPAQEREEFLDWLISTNLTPWIPTPDQLAARMSELNTQSQTLDPHRPEAA